MLKVQNTPFATKAMNLDKEALLVLPLKSLQIFAQYAPKEVKDVPFHLTYAIDALKDKTEKLVNAPETIRKEERNAKIHKVVSLLLLALTVSIIATAVLLAVFVNPLLSLVALPILVNMIVAHCLTSSGHKSQDMTMVIMAEIFYVIDAFGRKVTQMDEYIAKKDAASKDVANIQEQLEAIQRKKDVILAGIDGELDRFDLKDPQADMVRLNDLRAARAGVVQVDRFFSLIHQ